MSSPANAGDELLNTVKTGDLLSVQSQLGGASGDFDALGNSALHLAVSSGRNYIVLALIEAGADPNAQNIFGLSPIFMAIEMNIDTIVAMLLEAGAEPNVTDNLRRTPLHLASFYANPKIVALLIKSGADIRAQDILGRRPFDMLPRVQ